VCQSYRFGILSLQNCFVYRQHYLLLFGDRHRSLCVQGAGPLRVLAELGQSGLQDKRGVAEHVLPVDAHINQFAILFGDRFVLSARWGGRSMARRIGYTENRTRSFIAATC